MEENKLTEKLLLYISKEMLKEIEDFQFNNRIPSRSEAIRVLIDKGLGK